GAAPAPYRALDLIALARTASLDEGFAAEDEALADLVMSEELRAGLYAFDLVQRRAKRPAGAPATDLARPIRKVGVVGAGLMASQLGLLFAQRLRVPVVLTDIDQARVDKGVGWVHSQLDELAGKGRLTASDADLLKSQVTGELSKSAFADADFVIEAVFEELDVKRQVFAECEAVVSDNCVLATNTSSLSVSAMSADLAHPERAVGFHFFNPVAILPLVEIVRAERTDDATLATAFAVAARLRKSAVLVRDAPAFVVNRLLQDARPRRRRADRGPAGCAADVGGASAWPRAGCAGRGDPADARRGRRRRAARHRPVPAARRGLAVPPRRDHAVPRPHRSRRARRGPAVPAARGGVAAVTAPAATVGRWGVGQRG
ncbi:MAG: 3-hydroxyacyl-CoA dehydrogenase family protein, partial [Frankia sp.]|nr:3-hydroxyacyl-CoA dehydrogenase family protein [Frankia sp.]